MEYRCNVLILDLLGTSVSRAIFIFSAVALVTASCASRAPLETGMPIPAPTVRPFADGLDWVLIEPLSFQFVACRSDRPGPCENVAITVPAGFVTDFASVPHPFWGLVAPIGYHSRAAVIHDFLYWDQGCTRDEADRIFLLALIVSKVNASARETIFASVLASGEASWISMAQQRAAGRPRIIPEEYWQLPAAVTWPEYREQLRARGVRPEERSGTRPAYCDAAAGVSTPRPAP